MFIVEGSGTAAYDLVQPTNLWGEAYWPAALFFFFLVFHAL